jgi:predicted ArsR family transcriptional regulator
MQNTSIQAYRNDVAPTLWQRQRAVMEALRNRPEFTNNELAEFLQWPINTVTPRIFELRAKGKVEESSRRQDGVTGRTAIAWRIKRETGQTKLL